MITSSQLNTYLFCPRLLFLEAVLGCTSSNEPSEEGRLLHDKLSPNEVFLESSELGLKGSIDVVENENIPIEYKRGKPFDKNKPWDEHAVQLCSLALLMESNHIEEKVPFGYIWYNAARRRVIVDINDSLREKTLTTIKDCLRLLESSTLPPVHQNRKKCTGCNQLPNCLPDEFNIEKEKNEQSLSKILSPNIEGQFIYIDNYGSKVSRKEDLIQVTSIDGEKKTVGAGMVNQIVIQQPTNLTSGFLELCGKENIPIAILDYSGKWQGSFHGPMTKNVLTRTKQYQIFQDPEISLIYAKILIEAKIINQRVWLRRYLGKDHLISQKLQNIITRLNSAKSSLELLGYEGEAAKVYFSAFEELLKDTDFTWAGRKKHPSTDPVNSLLSFGYSLLLQQVITACYLGGLDPYLGFLHGTKHGKPSLALDLMEIYRTPIIDSAVIGFIKRKQCEPKDFEYLGESCVIKQSTRKDFVQTLVERFKDEIIHPIFKYKTSYQRSIHVEARLLAFSLLSKQEDWKPFTWR
ncbi:MAG: CRISPR-associated endonuclease Cas1 [Cyanobacteria bacterium REEB446]|nr:CRISPR-associated endonuclease Cas1 [Cyanobacteria bacterium REEB446]